MRIIILLLFFGITVSYGQSVSDEAQRFFERGLTAVEMAKSPVDFEAAIKEFKHAASLAPDWPDVFYNLGMVQEKAEKYNDAIVSLNKYLKLAPNSSDAETIKKLIYKLEYKVESILTTEDVIDVLLSFTNTNKWEKVSGDCISQPFAFISRKNNITLEFPFLYGLDWGPDMDKRSWNSQEIKGTVLKITTNTMCGAENQAAYCHFSCENEIQVVSRTQVKIKQKVTGTELSPTKPPVKNVTYSCEYRKK